MARRIRTRITGEELFDEKELEALKAQAKEELVKDRKAKARKLLLEELKRDALAETDPNEAMFDYQVLLPSFASNVMIDGVRFTHGQVYSFSQKQLCTIREIVQNAWNHEDAAFGKRDPNAFIRQRNQVVSAIKSPQVNIDSHFMRV